MAVTKDWIEIETKYVRKQAIYCISPVFSHFDGHYFFHVFFGDTFSILNFETEAQANAERDALAIEIDAIK